MLHPQTSADVEATAATSRRFTPLRRLVLSFLAARGGSATAYQLLDDLREQSPRAAPPTIYRTLQFLIGEGLVRHVATTSTFRLTDESEEQHEVLAICTHCRAVKPWRNAALQKALLDTALNAHFQLEGQQTEIKGICEECTQRLATRRFAKTK